MRVWHAIGKTPYKNPENQIKNKQQWTMEMSRDINSNQQQFEARNANGKSGKGKGDKLSGMRMVKDALPAGFLLLTTDILPAMGHSRDLYPGHISIWYEVSHAGPVTVQALDHKGEIVDILRQGHASVGSHMVETDLQALPREATHYRIIGPDGIITKAID